VIDMLTVVDPTSDLYYTRSMSRWLLTHSGDLYMTSKTLRLTTPQLLPVC